MPQDLTPEEAVQLAGLIAETSRAAAQQELLPATVNVEANIRARVFNRGQKADGTPIGQYSTEPFYLHMDSAREQYGSSLPLGALQPMGKPKKGKKRGAKARSLGGTVVPIQSHYFGGGYAQFRTAVGRQSAYVDLMLGGAMAGAIKTGITGNECTIAFDDPKQVAKADGNEERFAGVKPGEDRKIIAANGDDADELVKGLTDAAIRAVDNLFAK